MTNQELQSFKEMGIPPAKKKYRKYTVGLYEFLEYVFCFFLNKIFLFSGISPFGIAYFTAVFPKQKRMLGILSVLLGLSVAGMGLKVMQYVGALVIVSACTLLMEKELENHKWLYAVVASGSVMLTGFVFIAFNGFLLYDILLQVLEGILVFFSYFIFDKTADLIRGLHKRTVFEPTESLCLLFLCSGVIISLGNVPYFQGGAHVLSLVIILVSGLSGGFPLSCVAGVLLGVVNSLQDVLPAQVVAVYAVSALSAGLLQKKGRWGVVLGFFVVNALSMLYFNASVNHIISYYHILLAGLILFLIPDNVLMVFGEAVKAPIYAEDAVARLRDIMSDKLTAASEAFTALSSTFNEAIETGVDSVLRDPGFLFDKTADKVCRECTLMRYCWQKEYNETRHALLTLYNRMSLRGEATIEDVPELFKRECIHLHDFLSVLNKNYDLHKVNMMWAGRVAESRNLVAEQFKNLSSVLQHIKGELGTESAEGIRLERSIAAALDRNGITAGCVRVTGTECREVSLELVSCGGERVCGQKVATVLGSVLQVPMLKLPGICGETKCRLRFQEQPRYMMETGFAQVAGKNGRVCGDHYMLSQSADGKFVLALSDGMGQGQVAESQSSMTIHLIRQLIAAGFDKETALKLINSMLMVSTERESFATADLCVVNLYSGALEFIKIGASHSYVCRKGKVERVSCSSLPAGIICDIEADCDLKYAQNGDYVVLVTDGVTDALETENQSRISQIIEAFMGETPQELAEDILCGAIANSGGVAKDDMTVLVARLTET